MVYCTIASLLLLDEEQGRRTIQIDPLHHGPPGSVYRLEHPFRRHAGLGDRNHDPEPARLGHRFPQGSVVEEAFARRPRDRPPTSKTVSGSLIPTVEAISAYREGS
ncbi:MAG: hypothetical protein ACERLM_13975 [Acidimicrobiales bacterium]